MFTWFAWDAKSGHSRTGPAFDSIKVARQPSSLERISCVRIVEQLVLFSHCREKKILMSCCSKYSLQQCFTEMVFRKFNLGSDSLSYAYVFVVDRVAVDTSLMGSTFNCPVCNLCWHLWWGFGNKWQPSCNPWFLYYGHLIHVVKSLLSGLRIWELDFFRLKA